MSQDAHPSITLAELPKNGLDAKTMYTQCLGLRAFLLHPIWLWMCFEYGMLVPGLVASAVFEAALWFGVRQRSVNGSGTAYYVGVAFGMGMPLLGALSAMLLAVSSWASVAGFVIIAAVVVAVEIWSFQRAKSLDMDAIAAKAQTKKVVVKDAGGWLFNLWDIDLLTTSYAKETLPGKIMRFWLPFAPILLAPAAGFEIFASRNLDLAAGIGAVMALALGVASQNSSYFIHATRLLFAHLMESRK